MSYHDARKCTATNRAGNPCGGLAIRGGAVCRMHGGGSPAVKQSARQRVLEASDPVAARLVDIALHAEDLRVALVAIRDVLDRAGVTPPKPVEVITMEMIEAEIARLETELEAQGKPLPPPR